MVLVPFADGVSSRERCVYMYFWDERDGPDWSGWWVTPDYMGNDEFYLHAAVHDAQVRMPRTVNAKAVGCERHACSPPWMGDSGT